MYLYLSEKNKMTDTPNTTIRSDYHETDLQILDILSCRSFDPRLNFFDMGCLPRTVFQIIPSYADLESRIATKNHLELPFSETSEHKHSLIYDVTGGVYYANANTHNIISDISDQKTLLTTRMNSGHQVTILPLETYRREDQKILWEVGLYVTSRDTKEIKYGEELIVEFEGIDPRSSLIKFFPELALRLHNTEFDTSLSGINHTPKTFHYITPIPKEVSHLSQSDFNLVRYKRFRYLAGTQNILRLLKVDDNRAYGEGAHRAYRVELIGPSAGDGGYTVLMLASTEPTAKLDKVPDPSGHWEHYGPFTSLREAQKAYCIVGEELIKRIHINSGLLIPPLTLSLDKDTLKYVTVMKDQTRKQITVTSWETPDDQLYLKMWNQCRNPRIYQGRKYFRDAHPKDFMGKLLRLIPGIDYQDGTPLVESAQRAGLFNPTT